MAQAPSYSTNVGLPATAESADPKLNIDFQRIYNAVRVLQSALDGYTGNAQVDPANWPDVLPEQSMVSGNLNKFYLQCGVNIGTGQLCSLQNSGGGTSQTVLARANTGPLQAYMFSTGTFAAGTWGEFITYGLHPFVAGLTPGTLYYLSDTVDGSITSVKPTLSGRLIQPVGYAITPNRMMFNPSIYTEVI